MNASTKHGSPVPLVIGGKNLQRENMFDVHNPETGGFLYKRSNCDVDSGLSTVDAAASALESWRDTTPALRRDLFLTAADLMMSLSSELAEYMIQETGAHSTWADFNVHRARECLLDCANRVMSTEGSTPTVANSSRADLIVKEPYGLILIPLLRNAPYILGFRLIAYAVAAGNTVVFKGSELSPRTLWAVRSIFHVSGFPSGVLNFIVCSPSSAPTTVKAIIEHPATEKINFTGSTVVGRAIAQMAVAVTKPVLLELGGRAPAILCEDADLDLAVRQCVFGAFENAGQICMSAERILVARAVRSGFKEKLREDAPTLIVERVRRKNHDLESKSATRSMRPIIVGDVKPNMEIHQSESFGPTVSLIEFESEDEAVKIANDTDYGLTASIFSRDLRRALRLARGIESGAVHINSMTVHDQLALPHGGAKASGYGRFGGNLDEWLRTKSITYDC
ncbi:putative vanillin dehydrogenase [Aspergillus falconensis]